MIAQHAQSLVSLALAASVLALSIPRFASDGIERVSEARVVGPAHESGGELFSVGPASFRSPSRWCRSNPFIASWSTASFAAAAESLVEARGSLVRVAGEIRARERKWGRFDISPPVQPCAPMLRYGEGDGGKVLCNITALAHGCIIYSLGSKNQFGFEEEMVAKTPCELHTFDCTSSKPTDLHPRIHFHSVCIGGEDSSSGETGRKYRSLQGIARELGHTHIDLIKMDIEGHEYNVVESIFRGIADGAAASLAVLPGQLSFEVHYARRFFQAQNLKAEKLSAGEIALMWVQLSDLGYVMVSREDNTLCASCAEFTAVRAFC